MAVLVDEAVWPWRGARWAHLVSDVGVDELHGFARRLGLRRLAFQGDHYDIRSDVREQALVLGAEAVRGRDLVRRLRAAGLRLSAADRPGSWEEVGRWSSTGARPDLAGEPDLSGAMAEALHAVDARWDTAEVTALRRRAEVAVVVADDGAVALDGPLPDGVEGWCHADRIVELVAPRTAVVR